MKKRKSYNLLIIIFIMVLSVSGCSGDKKNKAEDNDDIAPSPTITDTKDPDKVNADISGNEYILNINTLEKGVDIGELMYGLFYEDINFAADGGLYAELVKNRSFEYEDGKAAGGALHGYKSYNNAELTVMNETPLNNNNPQYVRITNAGNTLAGIVNTGYLDGICVNKGADYRFSVYLKSDSYSGSIGVYIQDKQGNNAAVAEISSITNEWVKYELILSVSTDVNPAYLLLSLNESGYVEADMISLFPCDTYKNRENGLRTDLVGMLADLNPSFIRFPGGCVVEGGSLATAYNWKDTVGDVAQRKQNINVWHGNASNPYYQSYGLGFYEYFLLCEDLGAAAIPIINCGMACQARSTQMASMDDLDQYIQDALDLIEFANGSTDTKWGGLRAEMGHPEPFNMEYLGVGNEQWQSGYFARYEKFIEVLHKEHPEIKLISTSGPASGGDLYEFAWNRIRSHDNDAIPYADLVDEHYYNAPEWFLKNVYRYDEYPRNSADVFLGEYAAKSNTLYAAVAEAAYMTGLERNADVVKMAAYAPLFGNLISSQWSPDLIWFNNNTVFGSVNYYVQKMFASNVGDYTLKSELMGDAAASSIKGKIGLGTWLTSASFDDVKVVDNNTGEVLYENNFDERGAGWLSSSQGDWKITDDKGNSVFTQSNSTFPSDGSIMGSSIYYGDVNWSDYTLTLKAKKISGNEGFLISFAVKDFNNFIFWNIGGWNNTLSAIEEAQGGSKTSASSSIPMNIRTGEWYDIKIVVGPEKAECYLNDTLIHTIEVKSVLPVYQTVSKDEETGDIIIKLVNSTESEAVVHINLDDSITKREAYIEVLAGSNQGAQNSLSNKVNIIPVKKSVEVDMSFDYAAPGYSVTVIRIPSK